MQAPPKRPVFRLFGCAFVLVCLAIVIPAPLSGYWHTPLSDCLCDSKNLLSFQDGTAYRWATAHGVSKEPFGTYDQTLYTAKWSTADGVVTVWPGWIFMRISKPGDPDEKVYWGFRELRLGYIREVLDSKNPNRLLQPTRGGT